MIKGTLFGWFATKPKKIDNLDLVTFEMACKTFLKNKDGKKQTIFVTVECWNKILNKNLISFEKNKVGAKILAIGNLANHSYFSKRIGKHITKIKLNLETIENAEKKESNITYE